MFAVGLACKSSIAQENSCTMSQGKGGATPSRAIIVNCVLASHCCALWCADVPASSHAPPLRSRQALASRSFCCACESVAAVPTPKFIARLSVDRLVLVLRKAAEDSIRSSSMTRERCSAGTLAVLPAVAAAQGCPSLVR